MTGNLATSTKFGLALPISKGGARNRGKFIQLNCPLPKHSVALTIYGSEFTNADGKAQVARNLMKRRTLARSEISAQSGLDALAKSLSKPILAQTLFWGNISKTMITPLELTI